MISFYGAVIATVVSACVLLPSENPPTKSEAVRVNTIVDCIVADTITNDEMAVIATYFNVPGYLVVNNGNTPGLRLESESNEVVVIGNSVFENQVFKKFGQRMRMGEVIQSGLVWNMSSDELLLEVPKTGDVYTLWGGRNVSRW